MSSINDPSGGGNTGFILPPIKDRKEISEQMKEIVKPTDPKTQSVAHDPILNTPTEPESVLTLAKKSIELLNKKDLGSAKATDDFNDMPIYPSLDQPRVEKMLEKSSLGTAVLWLDKDGDLFLSAKDPTGSNEINNFRMENRQDYDQAVEFFKSKEVDLKLSTIDSTAARTPVKQRVIATGMKIRDTVFEKVAAFKEIVKSLFSNKEGSKQKVSKDNQRASGEYQRAPLNKESRASGEYQQAPLNKLFQSKELHPSEAYQKMPQGEAYQKMPQEALSQTPEKEIYTQHIEFGREFEAAKNEFKGVLSLLPKEELKQNLMSSEFKNAAAVCFDPEKGVILLAKNQDGKIDEIDGFTDMKSLRQTLEIIKGLPGEHGIAVLGFGAPAPTEVNESFQGFGLVAMSKEEVDQKLEKAGPNSIMVSWDPVQGKVILSARVQLEDEAPEIMHTSVKDKKDLGRQIDMQLGLGVDKLLTSGSDKPQKFINEQDAEKILADKPEKSAVRFWDSDKEDFTYKVLSHHMKDSQGASESLPIFITVEADSKELEECTIYRTEGEGLVRVKKIFSEYVESEKTFSDQARFLEIFWDKFNKDYKDTPFAQDLNDASKKIAAQSKWLHGELIKLQNEPNGPNMSQLSKLYNHANFKDYVDACAQFSILQTELGHFQFDKGVEMKIIEDSYKQLKGELGVKEDSLSPPVFKTGVNISSFMITPVQRMPRHVLLSEDLNKNVVLDETIKNIKSFTTSINNAVRKLGDAHAVLGNLLELKREYGTKEKETLKNNNVNLLTEFSLKEVGHEVPRLQNNLYRLARSNVTLDGLRGKLEQLEAQLNPKQGEGVVGAKKPPLSNKDKDVLEKRIAFAKENIQTLLEVKMTDKRAEEESLFMKSMKQTKKKYFPEKRKQDI